MSTKKPTFHKFNRTLDQEPVVTATDVQPAGTKIAKPTFDAGLTFEEEFSQIPETGSAAVPETGADHLKFLFGELSQLLEQDRAMVEETINTNPAPMEPVIQNPPVDPVPPLEVEEEEEEPSIEPERKVSVVEPVTEAKTADFHDVADTLTRPYTPPKPTPAPTPVPTPAPTPAPVVAQQRTGWVFTVHRNKQTNLIERIEADPKAA